MHQIEPHYNWRDYYVASEDERSPFFGKQYDEFNFSNKIYNYYIHPQWDECGSATLYLKILFADYESGFAIIELIGEWNDCINNDIMHLKRNVIDALIADGIFKFIMIGENVLNFHSSDDCYYEEWIDEVEDGWVCMLNAREHIIDEMSKIGIDQFFAMGGNLEDISWRTNRPIQLFQKIEKKINMRLTSSLT
jgi:hypothetical protein